MRYLKICNANANAVEYSEAFREIGVALRNYAKLSGRWDLVDRPPNVFYQGFSRVHAEYDALYWVIDDPGIEAFLEQQVLAFRGRFRRPELVRVVAQL